MNGAIDRGATYVACRQIRSVFEERNSSGARTIVHVTAIDEKKILAAEESLGLQVLHERSKVTQIAACAARVLSSRASMVSFTLTWVPDNWTSCGLEGRQTVLHRIAGDEPRSQPDDPCSAQEAGTCDTPLTVSVRGRNEVDIPPDERPGRERGRVCCAGLWHDQYASFIPRSACEGEYLPECAFRAHGRGHRGRPGTRRRGLHTRRR